MDIAEILTQYEYIATRSLHVYISGLKTKGYGLRTYETGKTDSSFCTTVRTTVETNTTAVRP